MITQYSAATSFFGPDYEGVEAELVGTFDIKANAAPLDITYKIGHTKLPNLPIGGYIIRYIEGSFLIMSKTPTFLVIGGESGLHVRWANSKTQSWTTVPFNIDYKATDAKDLKTNINPSNIDNIMHLEFSRPHKMQILSPTKAAGNVKIKVLRYVSKYLLHPTEADLLSEGVK